MQRKVTQITSMPGTDIRDPSLFALCGDGTIWQMIWKNGEWKSVPSIPQPEEPPRQTEPLYPVDPFVTDY